MPKIKLITVIRAPIEICFDLSRSIDLHIISTKHTSEQAISGIITGLIGLNEMVTWRARHFRIWQTLSTKITEFQQPVYFVDEMIKGAFKSFRHEHHFKPAGLKTTTTMVDFFEYQSPFGFIGKVADHF